MPKLKCPKCGCELQTYYDDETDDEYAYCWTCDTEYIVMDGEIVDEVDD